MFWLAVRDHVTGRMFILYWRPGDICEATSAVWRWREAELITREQIAEILDVIVAMERDVPCPE